MDDDGGHSAVHIWRPTQDVYHPEYGHGWVQGAGLGVVSVRFETRTTQRGITRSFAVDDPDLVHADPLNSLDWHEWLAADGHAEETGD